MGFVHYKKYIIIALVFFILLTPLHASEYKTHVQWEVDALLVGWVIYKYIDHDAEFKVVAKDMKIEKEQAVNTPNSRFRRSANETAFESALRIYRIDNQCIEKLVPIIRVVEMAPWRKSENITIVRFEQKLINTLNTQGIFNAFEYIDTFCVKASQ